MNYTVSRPTARVLIIMLLAALAIVGGVTRRAVAQDSPTCKTIGQTCESLFNCGSYSLFSHYIGEFNPFAVGSIL